MKLLKLTIINIASIESAVIDFENGALADESCFLICGPTGSGKTTLLDAMCLALYNQTPRIAAASKESYTDLTENFGNEIKIDDPRFLMRRGTDLARVELVFTDLNDQKLTACWQVERAKRKSGNNPIRKIRDVEWSLCDESGTVICSKVSEMKKLIPERLGLTFEQFCRTTLLAQGDFTKFLRSDESEKSAILEKLTGTEIYSEISKRIHLTKMEKENVVKLLQAEIGNTILLSEEEEKELTTKIEEAKTTLTKMTNEEESLQYTLNKLKEYDDNEKEYQKNISKLKSHLQEEASATHQQKVQLIADWDHSTEARGWWKEKNKHEAIAFEQESEEKQLKTKYLELVNGRMFYEKSIQEKENKQKECESFIESEKSRKTLYDHASTIEHLIGQIDRAQIIIQQTEKSISNTEKECQKAEEVLKAKVEKLKQVEELKVEKQKQWEEAQEMAKPYDLVKLSNQNIENSQRLTALKELKTDFENHHNILIELEKLETERKDLKAQIQETKEKKKKVEKEITIAEEEHQEYQKAYNLVKKNLEDANLLKEIRNTYHVGDTCPLCGGIIHQLLTSVDIQSKLQPMEEILMKRQKRVNTAITERSESEGELKGLEKQYKECEDKISKKQSDKEKRWEKLEKQQLYSECPNLPCVQQQISTCETELTSINDKLKTAQKLHEAVSNRNIEKEKASKLVEDALNEKTKTDNLISDYKKNIEIKKNTIDTNNRYIENYRIELAKFIQLEEWEANPQNFLSILKNKVKKYKEVCEELEQLKKVIQPMYNQLELINLSCSSIETIYPEWKNNLSYEAKEVSQLYQQWNDLHKKVIQLSENKKTTKKEIDTLKEKLEDYYNRAEAIDEERLSNIVSLTIDRISNVRNELNNFITDGRILTENIERSKKQRNELLKVFEAKGYQPDEKYIQTYKEETESQHVFIKQTLAASREEYGRNNEKYENNLKAKENLSNKKATLDKANVELNHWKSLHDSFGSSDGKKFRNIAQSYVLRHLLVGANHYLCQLTNRYELECNPGSLTILIRDKEAGGITRPTTTISGGEGFLISLSLALGLSSLSKKALAMDTLFIDEGFGTLDRTYLSTVMDTLERLHQLGGKKIGIISHVERLKERITTQIQVIKENNTASRVEVVCTV